MRFHRRDARCIRTTVCGIVILLLWATPDAASAQEGGYFAGAVVGVATLSGDPSLTTTTEGFTSSMYKPENGAAVNVFIGAHLREYVALQVNYIWNRNELGLFSAVASDTGTRYYEQPRGSSQHAVVGDLLVYFREQASRVRPYLSGGVGVVRFESDSTNPPVDGGLPLPPAHVSSTDVDGGLPLPPAHVSSTDVILRVAVGVDVPVGHGWNIRYSFSESIGENSISRVLDPPGSRGLMNFQNLVGVMRVF